MTILEIKEQLTKDSTAIFSFKDKQKRELNGCIYYLKQREEYVVEVYGISGQHTVEDFHAQKNEVIELKEISEPIFDSDEGKADGFNVNTSIVDENIIIQNQNDREILHDFGDPKNDKSVDTLVTNDGHFDSFQKPDTENDKLADEVVDLIDKGSLSAEEVNVAPENTAKEEPVTPPSPKNTPAVAEPKNKGKNKGKK